MAETGKLKEFDRHVSNQNKHFQSEEAEWIGLPLEDALQKGQEIHDRLNPILPLKDSLASQFVEHLKEKKIKEDSDSSVQFWNKWKKILSPFEEKAPNK